MKHLTFIAFGLLLLASCETNHPVPVTYQASGSISPYSITFRDESGTLNTLEIQASSAQDLWEYTYNASAGDIVYVTAHYSDPASGITLRILVDGKVYKENTSLYDTTNILVVSGTVPF